MSLRTRLALVGSSFLLAGLFGCSTLADLGIAVPYLGDPPVTSIDHLDDKPEGALVYLRGVVGDRAPFLKGGAYLLKDASGSIWIRTGNTRLPEKGAEIVIKGTIDFQNVPKGLQEGNEVYVQELEQMEAVALNSSPTPPVESEKPPEPAASPIKPSPVSPIVTQPVKPTASAAEPAAEAAPVAPTIEPKPSPPAPRVAGIEPSQTPPIEVIPPKPPAVAKPVVDPLDAFFLPHKQGTK